jgi:hypothetical protein
MNYPVFVHNFEHTHIVNCSILLAFIKSQEVTTTSVLSNEGINRKEKRVIHEINRITSKLVCDIIKIRGQKHNTRRLSSGPIKANVIIIVI